MDRIDTFLSKLNNKKAYALITGILFPVILAVFSLCKSNLGLDITDSAYNPYNYKHLGDLDNMWFFSYMFTNFLGAFFTHLPFGSTMLGLNIYTGLVKTALVLVSYFFFVKEIKVKREYVFLAVLTATGLCWCPVTVMYNYLTYLFFFLGTAFIYKGLVREKNIFLYAAGIFLGINVFVRFPNICEAGLILAVWYYLAVKKEKFSLCLKKTGICIGGFVTGLVPGLLAVALTRGFGAYADGIKSLFAMTEEATSYTASGMLSNIVRTYISAWPYTELTILLLLLLVLASLIFPHKLEWLRYILAAVISVLLLYMLKKKGMFDFNFSAYSSIYYPGILLTEVSTIFLVFNLFRKKNDTGEKLAAVLAILTVIITPLGTNNGLYANINYMFWVFPAFLYFLFTAERIDRYFRPLYFGMFILFSALTFQSFFFGLKFTFRDGSEGRLDSKVTGSSVVAGMKTTKENAGDLEELFAIWNERDDKEAGVLLYGNVSGLGFYLDADAAIGSAWPSLDSYTADTFEREIDRLSSDAGSEHKAPVVIVGNEEWDRIASGDDLNRKQTILKEYLGNKGYETVYYNERFHVMIAERNGD
ncbi:MAG: hypothetical protein ILP13_07820 [Lachnospiraceae bacterium]|nr:hypothetical protein [Lachnospiraceae bacterium]